MFNWILFISVFVASITQIKAQGELIGRCELPNSKHYISYMVDEKRFEANSWYVDINKKDASLRIYGNTGRAYQEVIKIIPESRSQDDLVSFLATQIGEDGARKLAGNFRLSPEEKKSMIELVKDLQAKLMGCRVNEERSKFEKRNVAATSIQKWWSVRHRSRSLSNGSEEFPLDLSPTSVGSTSVGSDSGSFSISSFMGEASNSNSSDTASIEDVSFLDLDSPEIAFTAPDAVDLPRIRLASTDDLVDKDTMFYSKTEEIKTYETNNLQFNEQPSKSTLLKLHGKKTNMDSFIRWLRKSIEEMVAYLKRNDSKGF